VESVSTAGNYAYGFTNFQFLDGDLKGFDMNAGRTGSSETVYFELTDLRLHKRDFRFGSMLSKKSFCIADYKFSEP